MAVAGLLMAATVPAWGQSPVLRSNPKMLAAFREAVARPSESTVRVMAAGRPAALGTIISRDGWIVTKASLLKGKLAVKLKDGRTFDATYVGMEPRTDLAMLKIQASGLKPALWLDSKSASVGNWVAAPGLGEDPVAVGVVGVATRKPNPRDWIFDPPPPGSGYLGVFLKDDEGAAAIGSLEASGPAAKAGLKAGDLILSVDGKRIPNTQELIAAIQKIKAGVTITLKIRRSGDDEKEIKVELGKRPPAPPGSDRGDFQNRMGSELSKKRGGFPEVFQTDLVIKPTDCGGPVVDLDGKVVGINIARGGRTESYAIPAEAVLALIPDLKSGKLPPPKDETEDQIKELEKALADARAALAATEKALADAREEADPEVYLKLRRELRQKRVRLAEAQKALDELKAETKP